MRQIWRNNAFFFLHKNNQSRISRITEVLNFVKILFSYSKVLQAEAAAKMESSNPANFGPKKYFLRECISEVEGQVPHPGRVPLPKEMTGKYRTKMAASAED